MADPTYQPKISRRDGGDELAVKTGGKITADGTQASHIADVTSATVTAGLNAVLVALENVGILASS